jgi:hypothetical protein
LIPENIIQKHLKLFTMKSRTIKTVYWILTALFATAMFFDGIGGITKAEAGQEAMRHLGYPIYVLTIFGIAKLIGVVAIFQTKYVTIKEWAYAGFTINFIGAFLSRAFVGDEMSLLIPPVISLLFMFATYALWKKTLQLKTIKKTEQSINYQPIAA